MRRRRLPDLSEPVGAPYDAVKVERDRLVKVSEFHTDTSKWIEASQEGPLFILRHGTPTAILIVIDAFEELLDRVRLKE
jgi:PHD/YefM family antitoxin component YafN of YafNO toxin-antitoxin module